ncbi:MAG TPA: DHHA1 domain-containing protein [Pyrinomonadaceae bacterium]|nr:DHHA1 domain-containing protein [Pyrinomonadaceae bacterium]
MTERLYYADSHLTEFDARVLSVTPLDGGRAGVRLDRTAFYPTGGGQPTDTGTLDASRVVECVDEEERGVLHIVEGDAPPSVGAQVRGRVDWTRRLDHIQQHTGQHILSQAFVELFDAETRGFRMTEQAAEIDLTLREPSDERIERAVSRANEIIWQDRRVRIHQVTAEQAAQMPLRKDATREGLLRVIEIEGFDISPCGGTHATRTGEVGLIAVRSWERAKGMTRVEFVAGARALADYRRANRTARDSAALFSVARDDAPASVARLLEEHKTLTRRVRALEELEARVEASELLAEAVTEVDEPPAAGGNEAVRRGIDEGAHVGARERIVARVLEGRDAESLKRLALALAAHPRTIALLGSRDGEQARLVFARSADSAADMNALMRAACVELDGRGGGRSELAQGGGRAVDKLADVLDSAARTLTPEPRQHI